MHSNVCGLDAALHEVHGPDYGHVDTDLQVPIILQRTTLVQWIRFSLNSQVIYPEY